MNKELSGHAAQNAGDSPTGSTADILNLETGTTFKSKNGYIVCIDRIWVVNVHMPNPTTMIAYSYAPISKDGRKSGKEQNTLKVFIDNILNDAK